MIHTFLTGKYCFYRIASYLLFALFSLTSCSGDHPEKIVEPKNEEMPVISHAKRLQIINYLMYSQVRILNPWQGAEDIVQTWFLAKEGAELPPSADPSRIIHVPLKKIICTSTTHLAMISALGESSSVAGFSGTGFIYSDKYLKRNISGGLVEIGYDDNLNKELILELEPDLFMIYGIGAESAGYTGKLTQMGIKVMFNADYLETDPLGKAEWIKLFGALYCREREADSIFNETVREYTKASSYIRENAKHHPSVLLGLPFRDTWYVSPGNSYISQLISDAGGSYLWNDTRSATALPMNLENVYIKALDADCWLNPGTAEVLSDIFTLDRRFAQLECYKSKEIYNNNRRSTSSGGNDYWESGAVNPHLILLDIASILHPELYRGRELYFYRKLN